MKSLRSAVSNSTAAFSQSMMMMMNMPSQKRTRWRHQPPTVAVSVPVLYGMYNFVRLPERCSGGGTRWQSTATSIYSTRRFGFENAASHIGS